MYPEKHGKKRELCEKLLEQRSLGCRKNAFGDFFRFLLLTIHFKRSIPCFFPIFFTPFLSYSLRFVSCDSLLVFFFPLRTVRFLPPAIRRMVLVSYTFPSVLSCFLPFGYSLHGIFFASFHPFHPVFLLLMIHFMRWTPCFFLISFAQLASCF